MSGSERKARFFSELKPVEAEKIKTQNKSPLQNLEEKAEFRIDRVIIITFKIRI